jgi:hypothetical protein
MSFYYIITKKDCFNTWFLWIAAIFSWIFILNSATRGWMISSSFLVMGFLLLNFSKIFFSPRILISVVSLVLLILFLSPKSLKKNMEASFDRLSTVEAVLEGDVTAEGTAKRWDERGPKVLTRFNESPIFGFGYSKVTDDFFDGHVGNHMLLLVGGYLGVFIFIFTLLKIFILLYGLKIKFSDPGYLILLLGIISILIIHTTSRNMVSFLMPTDSAIFLGLIFNHVNASLKMEKESILH